MLAVIKSTCTDSVDLNQAWEGLYRSHQMDLARLAVHRGCSVEDAEDLVQELFMRLFQNGMVSKLAPQPVERQRIVLWKTLKWMISNWFRQQRSSCRRAVSTAMSLELMMENGEELAVFETPLSLQNRCWAISVIRRSLARLRASFEAEAWKQLEESLFEPPEEREKGVRVVSKRVALYRARVKLRDLIVIEGGGRVGEDSVKHALFEAIGAVNRAA